MTPTASQADTPVSGEAAFLAKHARSTVSMAHPRDRSKQIIGFIIDRDTFSDANMMPTACLLDMKRRALTPTEDSSTPVKGRDAIWRLECAVEHDTRTQDRANATGPQIMTATQARLDARAGLEKLLSATPDTPSDNDRREIARLREALIACGRRAGALLADDVSTAFLMLVPAEVEAKIASCTALEGGAS